MTTLTTVVQENADLAAVTAIVTAVERAQNSEDTDAFLSLFRADAIWTTGGGRLLIGRDAIAEFTGAVLPGAYGDSLTVNFEVVHVLFLRPDVAAVKSRQRYYTVDHGVPELESEGSPMFVMTKEDGHWALTACQNTTVVDT